MSNQMTQDYQRLVEDVQTIITQARTDLEQAGRRIMVQAYWDVGARICRSAIGDGNLTELSNALGLELTLLRRCVMFYQQWPQACPEADSTLALSWGHYRVLMTEKDSARRNQLMVSSRREGWSRAQLQTHIKDVSTPDSDQPPTGTAKLTPSTSMLFIYAAQVTHVIDGDTLELMIDLGFDVHKAHRIRLRGINTPERNTPEGDRAAAFVQERLKNCARVVVKTSRKIDMYGRYIGDIFYLPGEIDRNKIFTDGVYLNNELLAQGLAELY